MKTYTATLSNVTTAGAIATLNIDPGFRRFLWGEVRARQTGGSATSTQVAVTTDAASSTPGTFDEGLAVVQYEDDLIANPITDDNGGNGFVHGAEDSAGVVKVHVVPDAGADNDYEITFRVRRAF